MRILSSYSLCCFFMMLLFKDMIYFPTFGLFLYEGILFSYAVCFIPFLLLDGLHYMSSFLTDAAIKHANWDTSKVREKLRRDIEAHALSVCNMKLSEMIADYEVLHFFFISLKQFHFINMLFLLFLIFIPITIALKYILLIDRIIAFLFHQHDQ